MRVLYTGDDDRVWSLLQQIPFLTAEKAAAAADGTVPLRGADQKLRCDAVIVDQPAGSANPLSVLKAVKAQAAHLPVIVLTGPDGGDVEAAALPVNYLTALLALYQLANLSSGETVLIHGAGGGVGTAAVQLARLRGATIIGTSSSSKHETIRSLGATHTIDYRTENVFDEVRRITNGRGADVILDSIGGESFMSSYRLLAPLGRLVRHGIAESRAALDGR